MPIHLFRLSTDNEFDMQCLQEEQWPGNELGFVGALWNTVFCNTRGQSSISEDLPCSSSWDLTWSSAALVKSFITAKRESKIQ